MARDYFADIDPATPEKRPPQSGTSISAPTPAISLSDAPPSNEPRSIRNIPITTRPRPQQQTSQGMRVGANDIREPALGQRPPYPTRRSLLMRSMIWIVAMISILALGAAAYFFLIGKTTVTVTPRSHLVTFDTATHFTAYPADTAATGTLAYTVRSNEYEDSAVVPASGTETSSERATGTITVYNDFSTAPVRLIKNTRFEHPDGHVYRIPATAEIPGKKGTTPGHVAVTVFADQPGPAYNIGPADRFTLPGLKGSEEFKHVYAVSTKAFTGGFSGTRPAVEASKLAAARSEVRSRLEQKAKDSAKGETANMIIFPSLMKVSFDSLPDTSESGSVRIHEKITAWIPVFSQDAFSKTIAQSVTADAGTSQITIVPRSNLTAQSVGEMSEKPTRDPITFTLSGSGLLVWQVNSEALAFALAGRDQAAFETIVGSFPGVEKAQASIMPFWKKSFPAKASEIRITLLDPSKVTP